MTAMAHQRSRTASAGARSYSAPARAMAWANSTSNWAHSVGDSRASAARTAGPERSILVVAVVTTPVSRRAAGRSGRRADRRLRICGLWTSGCAVTWLPDRIRDDRSILAPNDQGTTARAVPRLRARPRLLRCSSARTQIATTTAGGTCGCREPLSCHATWWGILADVPTRLDRIDCPVILAHGTTDLGRRRTDTPLSRPHRRRTVRAPGRRGACSAVRRAGRHPSRSYATPPLPPSAEPPKDPARCPHCRRRRDGPVIAACRGAHSIEKRAFWQLRPVAEQIVVVDGRVQQRRPRHGPALSRAGCEGCGGGP